ncbi:MAG: DUF1460 domain-containing protein [Coleofasciculus sp. S288]|nr:DUF1460 domain-containing protein [Coleofasciculus sp. S288]
MRKRIGLAVLGFALNFAVASRIASQARVHQPTPFASLAPTLTKQQMQAEHNLLRVTDFSRKDVNNNTLDSSLAIHLEPNELLPRGKNISMDGLYAQAVSQDIPETEDGERFRRIMQQARSQKLHERPMGDIMQAIANSFLGTAYKAGLLDESKEETLVVTLTQFDCVLFLETVLAIARGVAIQDYSYQTFSDRIQDQRYRDGQMDGYCSRLHYFSEWIVDNEKRGTLQNMDRELRGVPLNKNLNFMSTHRQSYPRLSDDATYQCIAEMESKFNDVAINYIPTNQIRRVYPQLQPGDIVAVATNISGLDVTHTGLVYRSPDGKIGFIHASPAGQVTIARDLERYVSKVENAIGILVTRPVDSRQVREAKTFR